MKCCKKCGKEKEKSLFPIDRQTKDGFSPYCKECKNSVCRAVYAKSDKTGRKEKTAKWRLENLERARELNRQSCLRNKEKRNAASAKYRAENREKTRALCRQWARDNADKMRVTNADRRAKKKNAIPLWAADEFDSFVVKESYSLAKLRTVETGIPWHVDHVVPLRNKLVCGLHCAANVEVITAVANHIKGNRVWPDMWRG